MVSERKYDFHDGRKGAALAIRVTPKAESNHFSGITSNGTIKVSLTDTSPDESANRAVINLLCDLLRIPEANIEVVAGESGRDKIVSILDLDAETVHKRVLAIMD